MSIIEFPKNNRKPLSGFVHRLGEHVTNGTWIAQIARCNDDGAEPTLLCVLGDFQTEEQASFTAQGFIEALDWLEGGKLGGNHA
jgi:hypothetical protein